MAPEPPRRPLYPLYNTTFMLHRLSPLYTGLKPLRNNDSLQPHARRFRDILVGDVLRGVRVGVAPEDDVLAHVGALQRVTWRILLAEDRWTGEEETLLEGDTTTQLGSGRGVLVTITYEKMVYTAILLRDVDEGQVDESVLADMTTDTVPAAGEGFQHFPVLLTKMPGSLRETFTDFLSTTFDARVSVLHLNGSYLTTVFEKYLADLSISDDGSTLDLSESSRALRVIMKDVEFYVGFDLPDVSASLKTIDIHVAREDLPRMLAKGRKLETRGDNAPFSEALASYIKSHLALDMKHEAIRVVRIACGAFVLGAEGRVKLQPPAAEDGDDAQGRATRRLVHGLVEAAKSGTTTSARTP